ncbi:hypothetical protein ACFE04_030269 [Oxalis oulophora]
MKILRHLCLNTQPLIYHSTPLISSSLPPPNFSKPHFTKLPLSTTKRLITSKASNFSYQHADKEEESNTHVSEFEDLAPNGVVYQNTLKLVECSMFAAVTGLVYFLSNSLNIENYFGCFFALPIVISSMRWGVSAGRKTMVATAVLLFVLSGPVKALTYLLMHGVLGFTLGCSWRLGANWKLSILLCTIARALGATGYVLTSSFLIRENIFGLITINIHASLSFIFAAAGINTIPSMNFIYILFGSLVSIVEQYVFRVFAPYIILCVPNKARNEGFVEVTKMAGESIIEALANQEY